jgi:hypothetical protein
MLDWMKMKRRISTAIPVREPDPEPAKPPGRAMSGKYKLLYKYLEDRYATTVVLTFGEIEDLLGFSLPDQARLSAEWWTHAEARGPDANYSDSWTLARRTAKPNLSSHTVVFERLP